MVKTAIVVTGIFAAIGGGVFISVPASAQALVGDGHTYRDSSSNSHNAAFRHYHRNRNANWNQEDSLNRIRLPLTSTNTLTPTVNVSPAVVPQAAVA
jgi:hypothetical protein